MPTEVEFDFERRVCRLGESDEAKPEDVCGYLFWSQDPLKEITCVCIKGDKAQDNLLLDYVQRQIKRGEKDDNCTGPPDFNKIK